MVRRSAVQLLEAPLMIRLLQGGKRGASGVAELPECITHGIYVLPAQKHLESVRQVRSCVCTNLVDTT